MNCNNHLAKIGGMYCQKIIPLVFDQSYSYYEQLCAFTTKLNQTICAINEQNLTIADFENRVVTAWNDYTAEMNLRFANFMIDVNARIEEFTTNIRAEWSFYKEDLNAQWADEKATNETFRSDLQTAWSNYQTQINSTISNFMAAETTARTNFETAQTTRQTEFETAQRQRQTNFETNMTNDWNAFQADIENDVATAENKYYISYPGTYSDLQTDPQTIPNIASIFDFNSNIVRVYKTVNGVITFIKRCIYGDIAGDPDLPMVDTQGNAIMYYVAFENPAVKEFFRNGITIIASTSVDGNVAELTIHSTPYLTDHCFGDPNDVKLLGVYNVSSYHTAGVPTVLNPASVPWPAVNNFDYIVLTFRQLNVAPITITQPTGTTTRVLPGYVYDPFGNGIIKDPDLISLLNAPNLFELGTSIPADSDLDSYTTPGAFFCASAANVATLLNKPSTVTAAFKLLVIPTTASNRYVQIILDNTATGSIYIRKTTTAGLSPWFSINVTPAT